MPPKRQPSKRGSAKKPGPPPPSSEDAKPNVEALNAEEPLATDPPADPIEATASALSTQPETITPSTNTAESPVLAATPLGSTAAASYPTPTSGPVNKVKKITTGPKSTGRRSLAEREELQRAEDLKTTSDPNVQGSGAVKPEQIPPNRAVNRGRGGGSFRGRGRGRGGFGGQEARASGPFSAPQAAAKEKPLRPPRGGGYRPRRGRGGAVTNEKTNEGESLKASTSAAEDESTIKQESGASKRRRSTAAVDANGEVPKKVNSKGLSPGDPYYLTSDTDSESEKRIFDTDLIKIRPGHPKWHRGLPVAFPRDYSRLQQKRPQINAFGAYRPDGTTGANQTTYEKMKFHPAWSSDDEETAFGVPVKSKRMKAILKRQKQKKLAAEQSAAPAVDDAEAAKEESKGKMSVLEIGFQSAENIKSASEVIEEELHQHDLEVLREELGQPAPSNTDTDGDVNLTNADKRSDKIYVFQFPPMMPQLQAAGTVDVKQADDATIAGATATARPNKGTEEQPIQLDEDSNVHHQPLFPPSGGLVGKLRVHASGRVSLDWGGQSGYVVGLGVGSENLLKEAHHMKNSLKDVMIVDMPEKVKGEEGEMEDEPAMVDGVATNLGQVREKFVVSIDEELLGA